MKLSNTSNSYGLMTILFHWVMAFLILFMLGLGFYMINLSFSPTKIKLYGWHKEWGFILLMLFFVRLVWRLSNKVPKLMGMPFWEESSARIVHALFYLLMFILPLSGWMMTSAAGLRISFFGLFLIPPIFPENDIARQVFANIHENLVWIMIVLTVIHLLAAVKHHWFDKDKILVRMLYPKNSYKE